MPLFVKETSHNTGQNCVSPAAWDVLSLRLSNRDFNFTELDSVFLLMAGKCSVSKTFLCVLVEFLNSHFVFGLFDTNVFHYEIIEEMTGICLFFSSGRRQTFQTATCFQQTSPDFREPGGHILQNTTVCT